MLVVAFVCITYGGKSSHKAGLINIHRNVGLQRNRGNKARVLLNMCSPKKAGLENQAAEGKIKSHKEKM